MAIVAICECSLGSRSLVGSMYQDLTATMAVRKASSRMAEALKTVSAEKNQTNFIPDYRPTVYSTDKQ